MYTREFYLIFSLYYFFIDLLHRRDSLFPRIGDFSGFAYLLSDFSVVPVIWVPGLLRYLRLGWRFDGLCLFPRTMLQISLVWIPRLLAYDVAISRHPCVANLGFDWIFCWPISCLWTVQLDWAIWAAQSVCSTWVIKSSYFSTRVIHLILYSYFITILLS